MHATHLRLQQADSAENSSRQDSLIGLDAVRGWAAVAVVVLHACVPYSNPNMPGLTWATTDTPHAGLTALMWAIEIVIMPIFLVMAGFLAFRSMASRGPWSTLKSRTRRLGWPFLLAVVFLIPVDFYAWMLGWLADGEITPRQMRSLKFADGQDQNLWGFSHLWFLQYLILYIAVLAVGWKWLLRTEPTRALRFGIPVLFAIGVAVLSFRPEVVWGFQHAFFPVPSKWLYSGVAFGMGVLIAYADADLRGIKRFAMRAWCPSLILCGAATVLGIWVLNARPVVDGEMRSPFPVQAGASAKFCLAFLTVASATTVSLSLVGLACQFVRRLGPLTQRLATASFAIYLLHHPILALFHVAAKHGFPAVSPVVKMLVGTVIAVLVPAAMQWCFNQVMMRRQARAAEKENVAGNSILTMPASDFGVSEGRRKAG
ncbi:acyltransferase family protein [Rhodopirellula halodulae]|uniref:acyltransferase family protein n=1 Tax=Rhodopirellula halodulae TaxID=2894198 RepID=UPI001E62D02B|nr:acyltransferase family protein [Rhodopirellula sp. JC737]MCC9657463.1 acyltransferase family protein [Rhodopirellula sp. JC737]